MTPRYSGEFHRPGWSHELVKMAFSDLFYIKEAGEAWNQQRRSRTLSCVAELGEQVKFIVTHLYLSYKRKEKNKV
jgi:hypothetical protein